MRLLLLHSTILLAANVSAYDALFNFGSETEIEARPINQIYQAALKEGGVDAVKKAFKTAFPGIKLNLTVDVSKYHDGNIDQQLANNNVYIYSGFKDIDAAFYGYIGIAWQLVWNADKSKGKKAPAEYTDCLAPEYKGKLVLTFPNDDYAVLFQSDQISLNKYGEDWLNKLLKQKPRWVRGTATGTTLVTDPKSPYVATFTSAIGLTSGVGSLSATFPKKSNFVSWPQHTAILKDAPHPEGAKLLQNFYLSKNFQKANGFWPVRSDVAPSSGFPRLIDQPNTNPHAFVKFMSDRERVERLRFWYENGLGTAQGLSSLDDDL
ncbi:hypothetical protein ACHAP5_011031 [Fusarium lateritium]